MWVYVGLSELSRVFSISEKQTIHLFLGIDVIGLKNLILSCPISPLWSYFNVFQVLDLVPHCSLAAKMSDFSVRKKLEQVFVAGVLREGAKLRQVLG